MNKPRELMLLSQATKALSEATTLDEVKDLRDKAAAAKVYIEKARLGQRLLIEAAVLRLRAERRLGEMLGEINLAKAASGNQYTDRDEASNGSDHRIFLRDLGLSKTDSSRSQKLARLSDDLFEEHIAQSVQTQRQPTLAGLLRLASQAAPHEKTANGRPRDTSTRLNVLDGLLADGTRFATVFATPPWPDEGSSQDTALLPLQNLLTEPVGRVCEKDAHLHVWADIASLAQAMALIEGWGFEYRSCLTCLKSEMASGSYWQHANHFLLLGTRGKRPFLDVNQPSWIECDWPENGGTPDSIHAMIETVSPGPYLQLFADDPPPNASWTVCPLPDGQRRHR